MDTAALQHAIETVARIGNEPENDLPAPFDQRYADLYLLIEDFLVDAIEAGVNPDALYKCVNADLANIIANHAPG